MEKGQKRVNAFVFSIIRPQGIPKVDLLELVLGHVKGHSKWPRLAMEYGDQLQEVRSKLQKK